MVAGASLKDAGWGILSTAFAASTLMEGQDVIPIMGSDKTLLASINPIWLIVALVLAIFVGEVLLYYGKYAKSNAQKAKAMVAAVKADRPVTSEIEAFDRIYIPSIIASAVITFILGYTVLFDVIPGMEVGYEITSPAFAAMLAFVIAMVFTIIIDYPIHEFANAVRNGGIAKAQIAMKDALTDPEQREKLFQSVLKVVNAVDEESSAKVKKLIDAVPAKTLGSADVMDLALEYLKQRKAELVEAEKKA